MPIVVRLGGKKGDLSGAIEDAVNDWLKTRSLEIEHKIAFSSGLL